MPKGAEAIAERMDTKAVAAFMQKENLEALIKLAGVVPSDMGTALSSAVGDESQATRER